MFPDIRKYVMLRGRVYGVKIAFCRDNVSHHSNSHNSVCGIVHLQYKHYIPRFHEIGVHDGARGVDTPYGFVLQELEVGIVFRLCVIVEPGCHDTMLVRVAVIYHVYFSVVAHFC